MRGVIRVFSDVLIAAAHIAGARVAAEHVNRLPGADLLCPLIRSIGRAGTLIQKGEDPIGAEDDIPACNTVFYFSRRGAGVDGFCGGRCDRPHSAAAGRGFGQVVVVTRGRDGEAVACEFDVAGTGTRGTQIGLGGRVGRCLGAADPCRNNSACVAAGLSPLNGRGIRTNGGGAGKGERGAVSHIGLDDSAVAGICYSGIHTDQTAGGTCDMRLRGIAR